MVIVYVNMINGVVHALSVLQTVDVSIANPLEFLVPDGNPTAFVATVYCIQM
jgi:hypothetical protein